MGMYTEIYVNIDFSDETPEDVLDVIKETVDRNYGPSSPYPPRWGVMFHGSSYLPHSWCAKLNHSEIFGYSLLGKGSIKNYEDEIEQFFEFIAPWSDTEFMGYSRYEEDREPKLYYRSEVLGEAGIEV